MEAARDAEQVLEEKIRPMLAAHGGNVRLLSCSGGTVSLELLGRCAGCPSAELSTRDLIEGVLRQALPWVTKVELVHPVDPELLAAARRLLGRERGP